MISGLRVPRIATFPRNFFTGNNVASTLADQGFTFPLLLRAPGYHTGLHFIRVTTEQELGPAIANLPGDSLSVIELLEVTGPDGLNRKYRVMSIDGNFYPAHVAISKEWKVHYFSSAMAEFPEHRAEDGEFLENMPRVLGLRVMETLGRIQETLKLDYWGMDFSVGANGEVLLFEANATMNVPAPDPGEIWSYRRASVQKIADAIRTMIFQRTFSPFHSKTSSPSHVLREATLRQLESALKRGPERIDLDIERAPPPD